VIPNKYRLLGRKMIKFKGTSDARGNYAGIKRASLSEKEKGKLSASGSISKSSVVGYLMPYLVKNGKPQLSRATKKDLTFYNSGVKELYNYYDAIIKKIAPDIYERQYQTMRVVPKEFRISELTTNIQVNNDQMAHFHRDKGNENTFGTITTYYTNGIPYNDGEFILGDYGVGFSLKEGDFLLVDQHSIHGTIDHKNGNRLSCVGFQSTRLINYFTRKSGGKVLSRAMRHKGEGKFSDVVYVIPSYKRYELIKKQSLLTLKKYKIPQKDTYVFVANKDEEKLYKESFKESFKDVNLIVSKKGLTNSRNFIIRYFKTGQNIVSLDDDVRGIDKMINPTTLKPISSLIKLSNIAFKVLDKEKAQLWGVYPVNNAFFMKNNITDKLKLIVGPLYGFINDKSLQLSGGFDVIEDYQRSINSYIKYGKVIRFNDITMKTTFFTNKGGLEEVRNKTQNVKKTSLKLKNKYPNLINIPAGQIGDKKFKIRLVSK